MNWPLWSYLVDAERITVLERAFVQAWGLQTPDELSFCQSSTPIAPTENTEALALLLVYLLKSSFEGHVCVKWIKGRWSPEPVWLDANDSALSENALAILAKWNALVNKSCDSPLVATSFEDAKALGAPLIATAQGIYLQRNLEVELILARCFSNLMRASSEPLFEMKDVETSVQGLIDRNDLLTEQGAAILIAAKRGGLSCIVGGPGSGKTFTAGHLLAIVSSAAHDKGGLRCALAAPTGRAAANVQRAAARAFTLGSKVDCGTLHALLGLRGKIGSARHHRNHPLPFDLILVDEASMIDARLMCALVEAIKPGARLILMGDPDQLPPVEMGGIFADILTFLETSSPNLVTRFDRCMRTEIAPIVDLAACIRAGDEAKVLAQFAKREVAEWFEMESDEDWRRARQDIAKYFLLEGTPKDPKLALKLFEARKILTPLTVGIFGTEQLNLRIFQIVMAQSSRPNFIPILVRSNRHKLQVFNGDQGALEFAPNPKLPLARWRECGQWCHFAMAEGVHSIPTALLPDCELAWCQSIHKSQGCEFDEVLLVLPPNAEHVNRQLLYTAVTRAKARIKIWSSRPSLLNALKNVNLRNSGLAERLKAQRGK